MARVDFHLGIPVDLPPDLSYVEKHRRLSARDNRLRVHIGGAYVFDVLVPATVFNPYRGVAANTLMELILAHAIEVAGEDVVDLACGSGVVGLMAILRGAAAVRFTDRNPNVVALRDHPLLRDVDRVVVQHLLAGEPAASADRIIASLPTDPIPGAEALADDDFRIGIQRGPTLFEEAIDDAARVLRPGGAFVFWSHVPLTGVGPYHAVLEQLAPRFDLRTVRLLAAADDGRQGWFVLEARTPAG